MKNNLSQQKPVDVNKLNKHKEQYLKRQQEKLSKGKTLRSHWYNQSKNYYKTLTNKRSTFDFIISYINHCENWYCNEFNSADRKLFKTVVRLHNPQQYLGDMSNNCSTLYWDYKKYGFDDAIILDKANNRRSWFINKEEWIEIINIITFIAPWAKRLIYGSRNTIKISQKDIDNIINAGCDFIGETTAKIYLPSYKYKLWNFERHDFDIKNHSETLLEYNGFEFKLPINLNDNFISKFK